MWKRYGYRRLHTLMCREGYRINHKKVYRLYCEEDLRVRRRKKKRVARPRISELLILNKADQRWSMDFVSDATAIGNRIRILTVIDENIPVSVGPWKWTHP